MSNWHDITKLVKKIAHPLIVMDEGNTYVVMDLAEYDRLLSNQLEIKKKSEQELLDQINRQLAELRLKAEYEDDLAMASNDDLTADDDKQSSEENNTFYIEPVV